MAGMGDRGEDMQDSNRVAALRTVPRWYALQPGAPTGRPMAEIIKAQISTFTIMQ